MSCPTDEIIAFHEAGHAAVDLFFGHDLEHVTIERRGDSAGHASVDRSQHDALRYEDELQKQVVFERAIIAAMAGAAAQRHFAPLSVDDEHAASDRRVALEYFEELDVRTPEVFEAYWELLRLRTSALVEHLWPRIERLAAALLVSRSLTGEEARHAIADPEVRKMLASKAGS